MTENKFVPARLLTACTAGIIIASATALAASRAVAAEVGPTAAVAAPQAANKTAQLPSEVALKDMRDVLRRLHRASLDLISEVEQRDMVVVGEPLLIEPIPDKRDPNPGTMEEMVTLGNALPPRKKWLDLTMAELEKLVALLDQEKKAVIVPSDKQPELSNHVKELDTLSADVDSHLQKLKSLTAGPEYKNIDIGREALAIYDDTAKMEKPWKAVLNGLRKTN